MNDWECIGNTGETKVERTKPIMMVVMITKMMKRVRQMMTMMVGMINMKKRKGEYKCEEIITLFLMVHFGSL